MARTLEWSLTASWTSATDQGLRRIGAVGGVGHAGQGGLRVWGSGQRGWATDQGLQRIGDGQGSKRIRPIRRGAEAPAWLIRTTSHTLGQDVRLDFRQGLLLLRSRSLCL